MKILNIYQEIHDLNPSKDVNNTFYVNCDKIIKCIIIDDKILDNHSSFLFIDKIIKYISSDDKNVKSGLDLLDMISKKKYLNSYNIFAIINCMKKKKLCDEKWLHNLINIDVYIPKQEFAILEHCGYGNMYDILVNCKIINHGVISTFLENINYDLDKIHSFLELSQLDDWNIILSHKYKINITKLTKLFMESSNKIQIKLINTLINTTNFKYNIGLGKIVKKLKDPIDFLWSSLHINDFTQLISNNLSFILEIHPICSVEFIKKSMLPLLNCEF